MRLLSIRAGGRDNEAAAVGESRLGRENSDLNVALIGASDTFRCFRVSAGVAIVALAAQSSSFQQPAEVCWLGGAVDSYTRPLESFIPHADPPHTTSLFVAKRMRIELRYFFLQA